MQSEYPSKPTPKAEAETMKCRLPQQNPDRKRVCPRTHGSWGIPELVPSMALIRFFVIFFFGWRVLCQSLVWWAHQIGTPRFTQEHPTNPQEECWGSTLNAELQAHDDLKDNLKASERREHHERRIIDSYKFQK